MLQMIEHIWLAFTGQMNNKLKIASKVLWDRSSIFVLVTDIVLAQKCESHRYLQHEPRLLKFENKTANFFSCFSNLSASTIGAWAPLVFYESFVWNASRICPASYFLLVMHVVTSCSMKFSTFSRVIQVAGKKECPQYFPMKPFSCARRVSVQEWNSVYSILCQSSFQTTLFCDAAFMFFWLKCK